MCYDIKASYEAQLKRARDHGDSTAISEILEKLIPLTDLPIHHASGFTHPELLIYTNVVKDFPTVASWGLIPHWSSDEQQAKKISNSTLNARSETIFKKPSYRDIANSQRCLVLVDGFYEHHHFNNNTYPFFITRKNQEPMIIAGLWSEWINSKTNGTHTTFTLVTAKGNPFMARIHNNPKQAEPRIPLILSNNTAEQWLDNTLSQEQIEALIRAVNAENTTLELQGHTVARLRGKAYKGNVKNIDKEVVYPELVF